jgi:hypothetical protein
MLTMWHAGFMRVFFKKMGIENLRFKPAYNPYTEVRQFHSPMCTPVNPDRVPTPSTFFFQIVIAIA